MQTLHCKNNTMLLLDTLLGNMENGFSAMNPVMLEIVKICFVSFGWIGSLAFFMWRKDKIKASRQAGVQLLAA